MGLYSSTKSRSFRKILRYFGPYQELHRLSDVTYEVQDFDPACRRRKPKDVFHILRMKPYYDPTKQIKTEDKARISSFGRRKQIQVTITKDQ
ncbi:transposon Ty3-I Gag-Pol polyprotein [Trichonephila clavipes]|nr:transposon Ty3-I Gag-Pol polyprotein [Trichonephila clavipes]